MALAPTVKFWYEVADAGTNYVDFWDPGDPLDDLEPLDHLANGGPQPQALNPNPRPLNTEH